MQQRKKNAYSEVEMKPLASAMDATDDDDPADNPKSKTDQWLHYALHKLHALLWLVIAGGIALYVDLIPLVIDGHPPARPEAQLNR